MSISLDTDAVKTNLTSSNVLATVWGAGGVADNGSLMVGIVSAILQTTITPPAGWTLLDTLDAGANMRSWLYYRWASGETDAPSWTLGSATKGAAWVGAYAGVKVASVPTFAKLASAVAGTAFVGPSLANTAEGWRIDAINTRTATTGVATTWTFSDPSDAERLDYGSTTGTDSSGAVYDSARALAAATSTRTFTASQSQTLAAMWAVNLEAEPGGGVTPPPDPPVGSVRFIPGVRY